MEDYIGKICPFCKTEIKEGEAVKVCPSCNIPHHEFCWEENKGCTTFGCSEQHYEEQHTNPTDVCENCGTPLGDGQEFCPKCGTPKGVKKPKVCSNCGTELEDGQAFCPKCGQKADLQAPMAPFATAPAAAPVEKKKNKLLLPIILAGAAVLTAIILIFALKGPKVDKIVLSESKIEMKIDDSFTADYTISPKDAADVDVDWKSSDEDVARVNGSGKITAVGEGSCVITVSAGGEKDTLKVTVTAGPDFRAIYNQLGSPYYCTLASDGSYLAFDTNWLDIDDYFDSDAYEGIKKTVAILDLPDSLIAEMGQTRALDGRITKSYDNIEVSWTYHPDDGLEVMFSITK